MLTNPTRNLLRQPTKNLLRTPTKKTVKPAVHNADDGTDKNKAPKKTAGDKDHKKESKKPVHKDVKKAPKTADKKPAHKDVKKAPKAADKKPVKTDAKKPHSSKKPAEKKGLRLLRGIKRHLRRRVAYDDFDY